MTVLRDDPRMNLIDLLDPFGDWLFYLVGAAILWGFAMAVWDHRRDILMLPFTILLLPVLAVWITAMSIWDRWSGWRHYWAAARTQGVRRRDARRTWRAWWTDPGWSRPPHQSPR